MHSSHNTFCSMVLPKHPLPIEKVGEKIPCPYAYKVANLYIVHFDIKPTNQFTNKLIFNEWQNRSLSQNVFTLCAFISLGSPACYRCWESSHISINLLYLSKLGFLFSHWESLLEKTHTYFVVYWLMNILFL